jgi:hypothetical protein
VRRDFEWGQSIGGDKIALPPTIAVLDGDPWSLLCNVGVPGVPPPSANHAGYALHTSNQLRRPIERAHRAGTKVGICGQAPSNYSDFAAFLVETGIDSISLNSDSLVSATQVVAAAERNLGRSGK